MNERRSALALIILLSLLALPTTFVGGILLGAWVDSELEDAWKQWRKKHKADGKQEELLPALPESEQKP